MQPETVPRAIVFLAWGDDAVAATSACLEQSTLPPYPVYFLTDQSTDTSALGAEVRIVICNFGVDGKGRKSALLAWLPSEIETALFLDVDTIVLEDISLGFDMAEKFGIAISHAPHYDLGTFRNFQTIMRAEGVTPRGHMVYNSGVVFFSPKHPEVRKVFDLGLALARKHGGVPWGDQLFLSLAIVLQEFNPYVLSPAFNHRAFGELVSGAVRIWHSYKELPDGIRSLDKGYLHRYEKGQFVPALKVPE